MSLKSLLLKNVAFLDEMFSTNISPCSFIWQFLCNSSTEAVSVTQLDRMANKFGFSGSSNLQAGDLPLHMIEYKPGYQVYKSPTPAWIQEDRLSGSASVQTGDSRTCHNLVNSHKRQKESLCESHVHPDPTLCPTYRDRYCIFRHKTWTCFYCIKNVIPFRVFIDP